MAGLATPEMLKLPGASAEAVPKKTRSPVARRHVGGKAAGEDVIVEALAPRLVLRVVDDADAGVDAEELQVLHIGREDAFEDGALDEEFDAERVSPLAFLRKSLSFELPARLVEQVRRLPQQLAVLAGAIADRRQFGRRENLRPQLARIGSRMASSSAGGAPSAFSGDDFEEARRAVIEAVEQILVGPFEIEGEIEAPCAPGCPGISRAAD